MSRRLVAVVACLAFTGCSLAFRGKQTTPGQRVTTAVADSVIAGALFYAGSSVGSCSSTFIVGDESYTDPGGGCLKQAGAGMLYVAAGLFALSAVVGWIPPATPPPPPPQPWNPDHDAPSAGMMAR